ncbi:MAG: hypothetical protein AB1644_05840 [Candidatus Zixiibacteriota bacterium]
MRVRHAIRLFRPAAMVLLVTASASGSNLVRSTPVQEALRSQILMGGPPSTSSFALSAAPFEEETRTKSNVPGRKHGWKAVLFSAAVPGAGEYYLGHRGRARIFFTGEALSWIGYVSFQMYGHWREDDLIRFARERANAQLDGKSDFFQDMVGFYTDIDEYNSFGRVADPDRPYLFDSPENHWRWQNLEDQAAYRAIKNRSREAYRRSDFMIGAMIVNRLVSVIDVFQILIRSKRGFEESGSMESSNRLRVQLDPGSTTRQVVVTVPAPF